MAWVTPPATPLPTLDVTRFPDTTDTLYLLSKDGAGSASPLVAALTDQVLRAAVKTAETRGGRLDRPLLAVLDEAANICKSAICRSFTATSGRGAFFPSRSFSRTRRASTCGESRAWALCGAPQP
jgi:hypothetical protein